MSIQSLDREKFYQLRAPAPWTRFLELRVVLETLMIMPVTPLLMTQPRGHGHDVLIIPGFGVSDRFMKPLHAILQFWGYNPHPWGLGINKGYPQEDAERITHRLDHITTGSISIVGWSMGGLIARLVAKARPDKIRQVITLGTPVEGGPKYTMARNFFAKRRGIDLDALEEHAHRVNQEGLPVPLTIIYSKYDGIVGWRSTIDRYNEHAVHVHLPHASHLGMVCNPWVWIEVAKALAAPSILSPKHAVTSTQLNEFT